MIGLTGSNLCYRYHRRAPLATDGVEVQLRPGTVTGIFGANGCGKSTLLYLLAGLLTPETGTVRLDGTEVCRCSRAYLATRIATVLQHTPERLPFRVREVVAFGRYPHTALAAATTGDDPAVAAALRREQLEGLAERRFDTLSGGEKQRVMLARALAQETPVLLLDEPAAHLDPARQLAVYELARELAAAGRTVAFSCHDLIFAPGFADHCVLLAAGRVLAAGTAAAVLTPALLHQAFGRSFRLERGAATARVDFHA